MKVQVSIVSDQSLPNLIAALASPPDHVYLVCSERMARAPSQSRVREQLTARGIGVSVVQGAPDVGLASIRRFALDLADRIDREHPDAEVELNATGGTKLMAMGFVEVFRDTATRIVYADTAHNRLEVLADARGEGGALELPQLLDVRSYLATQGFAMRSAKSDEPEWREQWRRRKPACRLLGREIAHLGQLVGQLNKLVNQALDDRTGELVAPLQQLATQPRGKWLEALEALAHCEVICYRGGAREIEFVDAESAVFVRGGWLEELAWHVLQDAGVHDACLGVTGIWRPSRDSRNEFDVLACDHNQLLFIECKTLRFQQETDSAVTYKIDSLGNDVRGVFGESWLLTAQPPSDHLQERCRTANIRVIGPAELPRLADIVAAWKSPSASVP